MVICDYRHQFLTNPITSASYTTWVAIVQLNNANTTYTEKHSISTMDAWGDMQLYEEVQGRGEVSQEEDSESGETFEEDSDGEYES